MQSFRIENSPILQKQSVGLQKTSPTFEVGLALRRREPPPHVGSSPQKRLHVVLHLLLAFDGVRTIDDEPLLRKRHGSEAIHRLQVLSQRHA